MNDAPDAVDDIVVIDEDTLAQMACSAMTLMSTMTCLRCQLLSAVRLMGS